MPKKSFLITEYVWWFMGKYVCVFTTEIYNFLHIVAPWGGDTTEKISELLWKVVFFVLFCFF